MIRQRNQRQRVETSDFGVARDRRVPFFHGGGIGGNARFFIELFVLEENSGGFDKLFLARRNVLQLSRGIQLFSAHIESLPLRKIPQLVIERHGFAPMREGALGVLLYGVGECIFGLQILKGME